MQRLADWRVRSEYTDRPTAAYLASPPVYFERDRHTRNRRTKAQGVHGRRASSFIHSLKPTRAVSSATSRAVSRASFLIPRLVSSSTQTLRELVRAGVSWPTRLCFALQLRATCGAGLRLAPRLGLTLDLEGYRLRASK